MDDYSKGRSGDAYNPYAAPSSTSDDGYFWHDGADDQILASRGSRLGAAMIDGLAWVVILVPVFALAVMESGAALLGAVGVVAVLVLAGLNLVWLSRYGQSIGKRVVKIRIVRDDGSKATLGRIVFLRIMVPQMIAGLPGVGPLFGFIDTMFIFREDQRCIHDLIADTKVIVAGDDV